MRIVSITTHKSTKKFLYMYLCFKTTFGLSESQFTDGYTYCKPINTAVRDKRINKY